MGGRGVSSFSSNKSKSANDLISFDEYAVASLNKGTTKGTSWETAIERFANQLYDEKVEYSAYIDNNGYIHALASTQEKGETGVIPISKLKNEKGVETVIHNHPHNENRLYGGGFSGDDYSYIADAYNRTNGQVKFMVATSNEGIYVARVLKRTDVDNVEDAHKRAVKKTDKAAESIRKRTKGKTTEEKEKSFQKNYWKVYNDNCTKELEEVGIYTMFAPAGNKDKIDGKLITQKLKGGYHELRTR